MTAAQKGRIFISYRRADSAGYAGRIYDRLSAHFGEDALFMDVDTIEAGLDFVEILENAVQSCDVLVVLIGTRWLNIKNSEGKRRLDNPEDFVRIEIAAALRRKIRVIPVLFDGVNMPNSTELPYGLKKLARRNAVFVNHHSFNANAHRLISQLELALEDAEETKIINAKKLKEQQKRAKRQAEIKNLLAQADTAINLEDWPLAKEKLNNVLNLDGKHAQAQVKLDVAQRKINEAEKRKAAEEKAKLESFEKAAKEKAEHKATEKETKEKAEQEAVAKAAKEKAEREAAEKKVKEKAEQEVVAKAKKEKIEQKSIKRATQEKTKQETVEKVAKEKIAKEETEQIATKKTGRDAAEKAAKKKVKMFIAKFVVFFGAAKDKTYNFVRNDFRPFLSKNISTWKGRFLLGGFIGLLIGLPMGISPLDKDYWGLSLFIMGGTSVLSTMMYPHILSFAFLGLGFFITGFLGAGKIDLLADEFTLSGIFFGLPVGALFSRIAFFIKKRISKSKKGDVDTPRT